MDRMQRFENLLSVALADGRLTEREMRLLSERAREWRLDDHQFTVAVNHCLERPGRLQIPDDRAERAELLRDALSVMASDGQLLDAEKRLFAFIAARMDFSASEIDAIIMELVGRSTNTPLEPASPTPAAATSPSKKASQGTTNVSVVKTAASNSSRSPAKTSGTKTSGTKTKSTKAQSTKASRTTAGGSKASGSKAGSSKANGTKSGSGKSATLTAVNAKAKPKPKGSATKTKGAPPGSGGRNAKAATSNRPKAAGKSPSRQSPSTSRLWRAPR